MSRKSNDQGRAYEFACLLSLEQEIQKFRPVTVVKNKSYYTVERAWETLSDEKKGAYKESAYVAVVKIFELEPRIVEDGIDKLELVMSEDARGRKGDVRDIVIIRRDIQWEIGLSIKHNHFAVKHNRLSKRLDFGKKWYGIPCSTDYWNEVKPIFAYLEKEKKARTKFSELQDKEEAVYVPLLKAFVSEVLRQYALDSSVARRLSEYLVGKQDFYKVISLDRKRMTQIQSYNLHGTLNQSGKIQQSSIVVPLVSMPTRIIHCGLVPQSTNTVELYMDNGWQFSIRIHSADTYVVSSLKFDIQLIGLPATIITINCYWR